METIQDVLEENIIPIKSNIHDCADTVGTQTLANGVRTLYTNDAVAYEYKSGTTDLWDSTTSTVTDSILDSKIDIIVGGIMNAPSANTLLKVELEIDATTPIQVREKTFDITRNNVDIADSFTFLVYNGAAALADGFKIYLTASGGTVDIKNKTILVRV